MKVQKMNTKVGEVYFDKKKREEISKVVEDAKNLVDKTTKKVNKAVRSLQQAK